MDVALRHLQGRGCPTMPVLRRGKLVGLLTMENVGEFLSVQSAVGRRERATAAALAG